MVIEYKKGMKIIYYESRDIEVINNRDYIISFENIYQLAELLNTSPELATKLKDLLEG